MDKWSSRYAPLAARVLLAHIFILSGLHKIVAFAATQIYMQSAGVPAAKFFLVLAIAIEVLAGAGLLLGWATRASGLLLAAFLVPVTLVFHAFWNFTGVEQQQQLVEFMKNLAIMGGLLAIAAQGAGELSLDARHWRWHRSSRAPSSQGPVAGHA
jgi:putative oxidoreductase